MPQRKYSEFSFSRLSDNRRNELRRRQKGKYRYNWNRGAIPVRNKR